MKEQKEQAYFEFSHWGQTVRITLDHHDISIDEAFNTFQNLLLAAGFTEGQVKEYMNEEEL